MQILQDGERLHYLQRNHLIQSLHIPLDHAEVHLFSRGECIIAENTLPQYLYYLVAGRGKIFLTHENGKISLINFIEAGDFIGEIELLNDSYFAKGIQAVRQTYCIAFPLQHYKELLMNNIHFMRQLAVFLGDKTMKNGYKISQIQAYPLENRLAQFILFSATNNIYREKHTEVCDYLGTSYRHLLYSLSQFCEKKYLRKDGRNYHIHNREALTLLAQAVARPH